MFDFLKKKITGFVDKLTKKEESKEQKETGEEKPVEGKPEPVEIKQAPKEKISVPKNAEEKTAPAQKKEKPKEKPEPAPKKKEEAKPAKTKEVKKKPASKAKEEKELEISESVISEPIEEKILEPEEIPEPEEEEKIFEPEKESGITESVLEVPEPEPELEIQDSEPEQVEIPEPKPVAKITEQKHKLEQTKPKKIKPADAEPEIIEEKQALPQYKEEKDKKKGISLSPFKAIKSFITREVEISSEDVNDLLDNLELEMLEADVEMGVAQIIREELESKLVGSKIKKENLDLHIKQIISDTFVDLMSSEKSFGLLEFMEGREKPVKIVFFGLNGTGKTTTIAKVAHLLMENNKKVVFAAADTFRAAAIEQMQVHADRLEVKLIKRDYGADPTSVGYDAVSYAKAHGIDAVLIDTAGRQDTNINLINELKKMERVLKPDLKLYVGESIAGSSMIEQICTFHKEIGIDGVILTKLDCDPKGGTVLSITKATGIPVVYIGIGQKYEDLEPFDAQSMAKRILS